MAQPTTSLAESLASLPASKQAEIFADITEAQAAELLWRWDFWARPNQLPPPGNWSVWLILAGRGAGKTRTGSEWVRSIVCGKTPLAAGAYKRIALVAETAADARDVLVEGDSGILSVHPPDFRPTYEPSKRRLTWPNGAIATLFNGTEPDQLRGPQFDAAWIDELCLVAGTLIRTRTGDVPIELVAPGSDVLTRGGWKKVSRAEKTSDSAEVFALRTSGGNVLVGTANHPVFTHERGFVPLAEVCAGDTLLTCQNQKTLSSGVVSAGIYTATTTATGVASYCTVRSIKTLMGLCRKAWMCTTSTATRLTTTFRTWLPFAEVSTCGSMGLAASSFGGSTSVAATFPQLFGHAGSRAPSFASSVMRRLKRAACDMRVCAQRTVRQSCGEENILATTAIGVEKLHERAATYNLEVEGLPEYFASGLLVHNCKFRYANETWDMLQFGLRLGSDPRQMITTTPRPLKLIKDIIADPGTVLTRGSTYDNKSNLAPKFLAQIEQKYAGTRLGRQELDAEILDDAPGALWTRSKLDEKRLPKGSKLPQMQRIVVAIDPASEGGGEGEIGSGAETGIIVAGLGVDGRGYVLDDFSTAADPNGWARRAVDAFDEYKADLIIAEKNQGGAMVEAVIRSVRRTVPFMAVHASRGKVTRAEPIAALYEQGRVSHVGAFSALEDQMVVFTPFGIEGGTTGDRVDALVWGLSQLFPGIIHHTEKAGTAQVKSDRWSRAFERQRGGAENNWKAG